MIGQTLAHFTITAKLGEGGMGTVYLATDSRLEREVALKILPPELSDRPERLQRFELEAKSASALNHPHIVTIHEIGKAIVEDGTELHYIAMEKVDGTTFREKIHGGAPLRDMLRWLAQAAEGLAKAHAAGILHRDLKPDNIMVTHDGYTKVLDFGLAKLTEKIDQEGTHAPTIAAEKTAEGTVLGTVGYMSPEQVQGLEVDHRSDMFSLGCVLYEAATRQRPFRGETAVDTMHEILRTEPTPVREMSPQTPLAIQRVIQRMLAKDPERRYGSMKDLALELGDLVEEFDQLTTGSDVSMGSSGSLRPVTPPATSRRPLWMMAAGAGAIALVALVVAMLSSREPAARARAPLDISFSRLTSAAGTENTPSLSPDGRFVVYAGGPTDDFDIFLLRIGGQNPINLTNTPGVREYAPAFSPSGESIAFASGDGGIFTMGATGESKRRLTDQGHHPAWSPDGSRIVFSTAAFVDANDRGALSELWTVDVAGGEPELLQRDDAIQPAVSPSGSRIAFWGMRGASGVRDIATIPAAGGEPVWVTDDPALDWNPVWAPDGEHLYFASDRGGSWNLWRVAVDETSGRLLGKPEPVTTPSSSVASFSLAADGSQLVYVNREVSNDVAWQDFDPETLAVSGTRNVVASNRVYGWPSFSPSGERIVLSTMDQQESILVMRPDGSELRQLTDDEFKNRGPHWMPDGESIIFYSDRSGVYESWKIDIDGSNLQQVTESNGEQIWAHPSPDGQRIVTSWSGSGTVIDISGPLPTSDSTPLPGLEDPDLDFRGIAWAPDGERLTGVLVSKAGQRVVGVGVATPGVGTLEMVLEAETDQALRFARFMSDSKRLIFEVVALDGTVSLRVLDLDTREVREVASYSSAISWQSIAPDDRRLLFSTYEVRADLWLAKFE